MSRSKESVIMEIFGRMKAEDDTVKLKDIRAIVGYFSSKEFSDIVMGVDKR